VRDLSRFRLNRHAVAVLLIDVQEKLSAAMNPAAFAGVQENLKRWIEGAKILGLPLVWTEQYVKGLGPTVAPLRAAMPAGLQPIEKLVFSSAAVEPVREALRGKAQVIALGMETHVCVFQTVRDLEAQGVQTFVPADAVISRAEHNRQVGLDLMRQLGSSVISTELGLFDLLQTSGTDEFRAISKLVR
jgi:nicotinamidase-related amidase